MTTLELAAPAEVATVCPQCHTVSGHSATCPTKLASYEDRVRYAARIYAFPYSLDCWKRCEALGISSEEFEAGVRLKQQWDEEHRKWTSYYGSQYYGGWRRSKIDGRYKPEQVCDAEESART